MLPGSSTHSHLADVIELQVGNEKSLKLEGVFGRFHPRMVLEKVNHIVSVPMLCITQRIIVARCIVALFNNDLTAHAIVSSLVHRMTKGG